MSITDKLLQLDILLESIIYDHFPADEECFNNDVCSSEYTQDELRESCKNIIKKVVHQMFIELKKELK